ncbi:MAG: hypothetical protein NTX03_01240 [Bacteroidetes bacterium]|nr:hypothetical protein [Bacteroidota bacterium]
MKKQQNSELNMFYALKALIISFTSIWSTNTIFTASYNAFLALIAQIETNKNIQQNPITGVAADKKAKRQTAFDKAWDTMCRLHSWAAATNNTNMLGQVSFTETDFSRATDNEFIGMITNIYNLAQTNIATIPVTYGVNVGTQGAFLAANTALSNVTGDPKKAKTTVKQATKNLASLFPQANTVLEERMDVDMQVYKITQPEFFNEYFDIRHPIKPATTKRALEINIKDSVTHLPIEKVKATITDTTIKRKSTAKGNIWIQNLVEGSYVLHLELVGYTPKEVAFNHISGETTKLTVEMVKI